MTMPALTTSRRLGHGLAWILAEPAAGKDTKFAPELVRFARRYQPGGSFWYSRLAMERLIFDELERVANPDAAARFRRIEQRARRDAGQRYFWRPGRARPERGPDLGAAAGR